MSPLEKLRNLPPHVRAPVLELLDQISTPLGPRELDRAIQDAGYSRGEARRVTKVLKTLNVIAVTRA
ncbi:hypothetical protein [uncultured Sphingomonas sp.]|jgi:hypothetical protein|uniref:hypothetical protein n=1 Tax=unclassified Sphingomonas TaxID=196159 RepID=UPI0025E92187|nr:hypothetical protein [uncultured Sphingomonas sp.]